MTRHNFPTNFNHAARLHKVVERPIENTVKSGISLLRLDFEVFHLSAGDVLRSENRFACRDLVIGHSLRANEDSGVSIYAKALGVRADRVDNPKSWLALTATRPWIEIRFGKPSHVDERQPFSEMKPFVSTGYDIEEYDVDSNKDWVRIGEASEIAGLSASTIRRRLGFFVKEHGDRLLRLTKGGHRKINLALLRHLLDE